MRSLDGKIHLGYKAFCCIGAGQSTGGFKNKIGRANSIAQKKSFLFCGHRVSGPLWNLGLLDSFERASKCPRSGWLQGPLTGDTAVNLECCLPGRNSWGSHKRKKAVVRIKQKTESWCQRIRSHAPMCVWYSQFWTGRMPQGGMSGLLRSGSDGCCLKFDLSS